MSERIPQSVAIRVPFKAVLSGTNTPAPGKVIAVTISKNGGAFGNPSIGATNATGIGFGWYYVDLSVTDIGALGPLIVRGVEGTIDDVGVSYNVVSAHNAGLDALPDIASGSSGAVLTDGTGTAQISSSAGQVNAENSVWDAVRTSHTTAGTFGGDAVDESTLILDIRSDLDNNSKISGLTYTVPNQVDVNVLDWKSADAPDMTGDAYAALTVARTEPGQGVAPVAASMLLKQDYIYKAFRNQSDQTAALYQLYNSDGVTVDQKASVSFNGTKFTRNAIVSGP